MRDRPYTAAKPVGTLRIAMAADSIGVGRHVQPATHRRLVDVARAAGLTTVIDVSDAFDGCDPAALAIHPGDFHPNTQGHERLARRLAGALWQLPALRPLHGPSRSE
jgi:hypothetical protein